MSEIGKRIRPAGVSILVMCNLLFLSPYIVLGIYGLYHSEMGYNVDGVVRLSA
jgi:hypothetical protein